MDGDKPKMEAKDTDDTKIDVAAGASAEVENIAKPETPTGTEEGLTKRTSEVQVIPTPVQSTTESAEPVKSENFVIYHNICYLGAASVTKCSDEDEVRRLMCFMNEQKVDNAIQVAVSVPLRPDDDVVVYEEASQEEITRFSVMQIKFFVRGIKNTIDAACFAFTTCHGEDQNNSIFQCHAFRCEVIEAVERIFESFGRAFVPLTFGYLQEPHETSQTTSQKSENPMFDVTLEIKEDDGKGNYNAVPREKGCFKLRSSTAKHIVVSVQQVSNGAQEFIVDRCFGLLLSPGRMVRESDMQLLEILSWSIGSTQDRKTYVATGQWDSNDPAFQALNAETPKESVVFFTVAADLVIKGIQEPIRFTIETEGRVYPSTERFWMLGRKYYLTQQFALVLQRVGNDSSNSVGYKVQRVQPLKEVNKSKMNFNLNFTSFIRTPSLGEFPIETPTKEDDEESDEDEPLQSGTGKVSREFSDEQLKSWTEILDEWPKDGSMPLSLRPLVIAGIPDALRTEIWQRLSGCTKDEEIMQQYRSLLGKDCPNDDMIQRDISRTFPANDKFKDVSGQDLLYKISKTYSLYDTDVSYCQGISFIGAALLLKMPEEQAFCLLVKIMYNYSFRDLYRDGFEHLRMRLYQLDRLLEVHVPELHAHFLELGIESHMYASQWLLTLFTAKFPLNFVFRVIDLFLLEGMRTIFQVAISLLMAARKELLVLDFEGILKYFRVTLPKKFRSAENIDVLMRHAGHLRIRKLKKYAQEFKIKQESEIDPVVRLSQENEHLKRDQLRSEQMINTLQQSKDSLEATLETTVEEMKRVTALLKEAEDFNQRLKEESDSVKELFQKEVKQYDVDNEKKASLITDYKQICSQLSLNLEEEKRKSMERMTFLKENLCEGCSPFVATAMNIIANGGERKTSASPIPDAGARAKSPEATIQPLENELAKTKISLAEAECSNDELSHKLALALQELEAYRGKKSDTWLWRNLTFSKDSKKHTNDACTEENLMTSNAPVQNLRRN